MTKTNQQIVTNAFTIIGVVADGKQPTPYQSSRGIEILNDNMLTQQRDGWSLGWFPQSVSSLTSISPLRDEDIGDVQLCLGAWLAPWFGVTITPDPDPTNPGSIANQIRWAFERLNKRSGKYVEADLGELSRAQGGPYGGPNWL